MDIRRISAPQIVDTGQNKWQEGLWKIIPQSHTIRTWFDSSNFPNHKQMGKQLNWATLVLLCVFDSPKRIGSCESPVNEVCFLPFIFSQYIFLCHRIKAQMLQCGTENTGYIYILYWDKYGVAMLFLRVTVATLCHPGRSAPAQTKTILMKSIREHLLHHSFKQWDSL